jgi:ABC-type branched-subunit amino acid transport system substrate-binding protein
VTLRRALILAAIVFVALAAWQILGGTEQGWFAVGAYALVLLVLLAFERSRYRPKVDRSSGQWQPTGETFVDPATGEKTVVYYNARTGERDYRALS